MDAAEKPVLVAGECDDQHCQNEVFEPSTRSTVFDSVEAMREAAKITGWFVDEDGTLACPLHARRRRGRVVGTRFSRGRRDLGISAGSWYDE